MTHILRDLTHKMEGHPPKREVSWVVGIYIYLYQHLPKGAVWTLRDGGFSTPYHPFSTPWKIQVSVTCWFLFFVNCVGLMIWFQWFLLSWLCHMQWYFNMFFSDVLSDSFVSAKSSSLHVRILINSNTFMLIWYDHPLHGNVGTNKPMSEIVTSPSPLKHDARVMTEILYIKTHESKGCMIHCTGF